MIAHLTGLKPRFFYHVIGDAHIYNNHLEQCNRQVKRTPKPFPKFSFRDASRIHTIDDFTLDKFKVENYQSHPAIMGDMSV